MLSNIDKKFIDRLVERKGKGYYYHLLQGFYSDRQRTCKNCEYRYGDGSCIGMIGRLKIC